MKLMMRGLKNRSVDLVEATLEQSLRTDVYAALVADPRSVHAAGVVDPKMHIRKELARAMADYTESSTFRKLLDLDVDHELACKCTSQSGVFDVHVLESVGSCLPATVKASLLDRATKSEILVKLVTFKKRQEIGNRMRKDNRRFCNRLLRLEVKKSGASIVHAKDSVIVRAQQVRFKYYAGMEVSLENHTLTNNVFDGLPADMIRTHTRRKSARIRESEVWSELDCVQKAMAKATALCAYVASREEGGALGLFVQVYLSSYMYLIVR